MTRPNMQEMKTLEELAAWAAANHQGGFLPNDWMPLLLQAGIVSQARWQPIETAPKDGDRILLCQNVEGYGPTWQHIYSGKWLCYEDMTGYWDGGDYRGQPPTFWMPLPPPPVVAANDNACASSESPACAVNDNAETGEEAA